MTNKGLVDMIRQEEKERERKEKKKEEEKQRRMVEQIAIEKDDRIESVKVKQNVKKEEKRESEEEIKEIIDAYEQPTIQEVAVKQEQIK